MIQLFKPALTACLVLLPFLATAQLSQGFKFLDQSEYGQAIQAFESVVSDEKDGVAAKFGLATCYYRQAESVSDLTKGLGLLRSSKEQYGTLSQSDKSRFSKYNLSLNSYDRLSEDLQVLALKLSNDNNSLLQLDTMMESMKPISTRVQKDLDITRKKLVQYAVENADDYLTLTSLVKKHYLLVTTSSYKNELSVQQNLLPSFTREYGWQNLDNFVKDHPQHFFAIDCWSKEFIAALKPASVKKLLRLTIDYPYSALSDWTDYHISKQTKRGTNTKIDYNLDQAEKDQLELLKIGWKVDDVIDNEKRTFDDATLQNLFVYIQKMKSTVRGYYMIQNALEKCLNQRQWASASAILAFAQPLFPDFQPTGCKTKFFVYQSKQDWFAKVTPIVNQAAEGLVRKPVDNINTPKGDEYSPIPSADGKSLYFAAKERDVSVGGEDIYLAHYNFDSLTWSEPELVRSLSSTENESPVAITFDGNEMLLFREGKLYTSRLTKEGWAAPVIMPSSINSFAWIGEASYSSDGNVMIFAASETTPELFQESNKDLYVTQRGKGGQWAVPKLLGMDVNTFDDERSPFLYPDDVTLYFSSAGHAGLGEKDIFYTKRLDDTWTNWSVPKNLGKEVNSLGDDWGYTISLNPNAWDVYSSKANLSTELSDIYTSELPSFARPSKVVPYSAKIENAGPNVKIVLINPDGTPFDTVRARPDGSFTLPMRNGKPLRYIIVGDNILPKSITVPAEPIAGKDELVTVNSIPDMIRTGDRVPLDNITFDYNKSEIKPESYPTLEGLYALFYDKTWRVEISGHTDDTGNTEYNMALSVKRAEAVKAFLVNKGISAERLSSRGFGAEKPVADNKTDAGRALNRRVEIGILK